ncbi:hypothetical protein DFH11DRAFT_1724516 [Phellopilus nigrolimitatus]|nr:hypothetical protein DFH11DRAFT_1724516 [Phellopilus nigrolimitatus]
MHIKKLKVRKGSPGYKTPCAGETLAMLNCWAASRDLSNMGACAASAQSLAECMRNNTVGAKGKQSTINYHLARLQKVLK